MNEWFNMSGLRNWMTIMKSFQKQQKYAYVNNLFSLVIATTLYHFNLISRICLVTFTQVICKTQNSKFTFPWHVIPVESDICESLSEQYKKVYETCREDKVECLCFMTDNGCWRGKMKKRKILTIMSVVYK